MDNDSSTTQVPQIRFSGVAGGTGKTAVETQIALNAARSAVRKAVVHALAIPAAYCLAAVSILIYLGSTPWATLASALRHWF